MSFAHRLPIRRPKRRAFAVKTEIAPVREGCCAELPTAIALTGSCEGIVKPRRQSGSAPRRLNHRSRPFPTLSLIKLPKGG
jgi:hypothetical protein